MIPKRLIRGVDWLPTVWMGLCCWGKTAHGLRWCYMACRPSPGYWYGFLGRTSFRTFLMDLISAAYFLLSFRCCGLVPDFVRCHGCHIQQDPAGGIMLDCCPEMQAVVSCCLSFIKSAIWWLWNILTVKYVHDLLSKNRLDSAFKACDVCADLVVMRSIVGALCHTLCTGRTTNRDTLWSRLCRWLNPDTWSPLGWRQSPENIELPSLMVTKSCLQHNSFD